MVSQWNKNPATSNRYQTPVISSADDGALYKAIIHGYQGMQESDEVMLSVFRPSPIESVGINFEGENGYGPPTPLFPFDVAGFHLQAYWNNLGERMGLDVSLVNSSNRPSLVTLMYSTSGEWGVWARRR